MLDGQKRELPYKKLPSMWNYLYPFIKDIPEPAARVTQFLSQSDAYRPGKKALYVHIPFCDTICTFCPFIKSTAYQEKLEPYVNALIKELKMIGSSPYIQQFELGSIYVGGGTPSVLTPDMITRLTSTIRENFKLADDYEWTFEVEAKSATEDKFKAMAAGGINRISFGVQTFDPEYRKIFNLTATLDEVRNVRNMAEKYFKAYNMDLLYQLPGQTLERLQQDLDQAKELGCTSFDAYPLEYLVTAKGFLNLIKNGKIEMPPSANDKLEMQEHIRRWALENGYEQNYIYTFTRSDAKHKSWVFGETIYGVYEDEYIGCGQAAGSYLAGMAHNNHVTTDAYIHAVEAGELPVMQAYDYHAMEKGLIYFPKKMTLSLDYLNSIKDRIDPFYLDKLAEFESLGLVRKEENQLVLTEEGKKYYMFMMVELLPADQREIYMGYVTRAQEDRQWHENLELISVE
ncbi:coproporphyrinogen-III oxidase family protein [Tumebacillus sp. DT12]|uniref:Heme chaperone HemW n=1 Tax=Tumebacillus lacus TaxID=2995335 RepID=A0ABT3WYY2_9BACL|nr:coproporphyrinogen-III oxidase family protein [Tumebacillus lacus]MCX7569885.1 coproporphyrinogen-III oxidase family protein [Tumebacillus lacus]